MTRVAFRYFASLRESLGSTGEEAELEGGTVMDALDWLVARYGDRLIPRIFDGRNRLRREFRVLHNGVVCAPARRSKEKVSDGDEIVIVPPVAGG